MPRDVGIKTLSPGKQFIGFCIVRNKELRYKSNDAPYLHLELGDRSGRLNAKVWDDVQKFDKLIEVGKVIKIKAVVQRYKNRKELKISQVRKIRPDDNVELSLLLPTSKKDIAKLREQFYAHVSGFQNAHLKKLLSNIFSDEALSEQFFISPAGKLWHHNYLYGMIEHVVAMLDIADVIGKHYPEVDIDLLKCGIILHDMGKFKSFDLSGFIDYTDEGRLIGHITIGYDFVKQKLNEMEDFPIELHNQILHMVLSHQGKMEHGSPVSPMTIEAVILHFINELDSKTNALSRIIDSDILPDSNWSKYIPLLDRFIYHNRDQRKNKLKKT